MHNFHEQGSVAFTSPEKHDSMGGFRACGVASELHLDDERHGSGHIQCLTCTLAGPGPAALSACPCPYYYRSE
jgi:hypothetical protein